MSQIEASSVPMTTESSPGEITAGEELHERLSAAAGDRTYRALSELTGVHAETVRRYMQGQSPSVEFVMRLCSAMEISCEWLLTGRGPMRLSDTRKYALREANPAELLSAMASTIDRVTDRVGRLEVFVQTLETRLRAAASLANSAASPDETASGGKDSDGSTAPVVAAKRARRIGSAVAKPKRPDAD